MNGTAIALALVQITVAPGPPRIAVGSVVVKAPRRLDILTEGELTATLRFLRDIRQVLRDEKKVFVDLADCDHIGMVGCLMLTAEIETCRAEWPDSIDGRDPMNPNAARMLASFGFHKLLGFNGTETLPATWLVGMKSGRGAVSDVAAQLGEVADLALRLWGDQAYADRVHAVLNEAVTNVIMHAYPPDIAGASSRRRWWALGAADIEEKEAIFIALDHGVSVPRTAIRTFGDMLDEFLDDPSNKLDHLVTFATIKLRRSQTAKPQHGKGLAAMVGLIQERSVGGSVEIFSGKGRYFYRSSAPGTPQPYFNEGALPLAQPFPGTLVIWRVQGPRVTGLKEAI